MLRTLRQPKWIVAAAVVMLLAAVFIRLGFWQLDRLEQRRTENATIQARMAAEPVPLDELLAGAGNDLDSIEYRRTYVPGVDDTGGEVLIRSQVELGQAGFHVITPLHTDGGWGILVNRGWVPLTMDTPPVDAPPDPGSVMVEGWIQLTQERPPLGPEDAPGDLDVFSRVDIGRIGEQLEYPLAPVYLVATGEGSDDLPIQVDPPEFTNEGPHLAYAIQWFGFALVGIVGLYFLLRRQNLRARSRRG